MGSSSSFPLQKRDITCIVSFLLVLLSSSILLHRNNYDPFRIPPYSSEKRSCDYSYGKWVKDESRISSYTEDCRFIDPGFRCRRNGREDSDYLRYRWQPHGCNLPIFDADNMLEKYRNKRIVFAGDSIGRNQWESFICMVAQGVRNKSTIYEQNGRPITKHKGYLSIRFHLYNMIVEYYRVPFLVAVGPPPANSSTVVKKSIRVDQLHGFSQRWVGADVIVFNSGHWWTQDKITKKGFFFEEGRNLNMTMDSKEAFTRALQTWKRWVVQNLQSRTTHVFFRTYSPVHFRGGTWVNGGRCDEYSRPMIPSDDEQQEREPWNNVAILKTVEQIKTSTEWRSNGRNLKIELLNITYMTEFRGDGHPSDHREASYSSSSSSSSSSLTPVVQDCSHWCLPGIPDAWNSLLYAHLLSN